MGPECFLKSFNRMILSQLIYNALIILQTLNAKRYHYTWISSLQGTNTVP